MPWLRNATSKMRRPSWATIMVMAGCLIIPFLVLNSSIFDIFYERVITAISSNNTVPEDNVQHPTPPFYEWDTRSAFQLVPQEYAIENSTEELCASFPTHLLNNIQPVLKTGHGVLEERVPPQLQSVSACLFNLLVFSDLDEIYAGHDIIDVIGDIPADLKDHEQLQAWHVLREGITSNSLKYSNATRKDGWETDKFKFLTSVSRAWKMRPEKRWYVFYEADTYLVWDNIFRLLENFDPDKPWYFGSPSPGRDDVWFANGGPGFIISREAMRRLVVDDWDKTSGEYLGSRLTQRHWDTILNDCCGDSIIGWALWQENVSISGLWPEFNPHPPHGVPFSDLYWCQPILTMHKPSTKDIVGVWRLEWGNREVTRPLLYRDLATSYFNFTELTIVNDHDNADWDGFGPPTPSKFYHHDPHASSNACDHACQAHDDCFQWTYHLRKCTFVRSFRFGKHRDPELGNGWSEEEKAFNWDPEDLRFTSGWCKEKIKGWIDSRPCKQVKWVRPSTVRIF